jgi:hypothetical protein
VHATSDPVIAKRMIRQTISYLMDSRVALAGANMLSPNLNDKLTQALSVMSKLEKEVRAVRSPAKTV